MVVVVVSFGGLQWLVMGEGRKKQQPLNHTALQQFHKSVYIYADGERKRINGIIIY